MFAGVSRIVTINLISSVVNTAQTLPDARRLTAIADLESVRNVKNLHRFLDVDDIVSIDQAGTSSVEAELAVVWGHASDAQQTVEVAQKNAISVLLLEEGWISGCADNTASSVRYSIQTDTVGLHNDSSKPNDLENLLNLPEKAFSQQVSADNLAYARHCRKLLVHNNITKHNFVSQSEPSSEINDVVLVIDQAHGSASAKLGGMDQAAFEKMLLCAIDENPDATIVVRSHPDVLRGRDKGFLTDLAHSLGISVSGENTHPIKALKQASRVYVGTSQLGYEALLCEKPVTVFGQPFYAGWGLSDDRSPVSRRQQHRSIDELFYASHIAHAVYRNPVTGDQWELRECLAHVQLQLHMFALNARHYECVGITPWKRKYIQQYLRSPDGTVRFKPAIKRSDSSPDCYVTWGYRRFADIQPNSSQQVNGVPLMRLEDGYIRSTGLGSDFNAPASLIADELGMYFDPQRESELESLLNHRDCTPDEIFRAIKLKKLILSSRLSKYNVGTQGELLFPDDNRLKVLVIGQVEDDQSIRRGCDSVNRNSALLEAVRAARPDAWIRYKPHPDVVAGNRQGAVSTSVLNACADVVDADASIIDCIDACDELHTMTSLSGFEALLRGKKVVTYGAPFYAGWGLTEEHQPVARRRRRRTLDELVYMAMIEYPRYVDLSTGEFTTPEDLVLTIEKQKQAMNKNSSSGWTKRKLNKVVNIVKGLRYAP